MGKVKQRETLRELLRVGRAREDPQTAASQAAEAADHKSYPGLLCP